MTESERLRQEAHKLRHQIEQIEKNARCNNKKLPVGLSKLKLKHQALHRKICEELSQEYGIAKRTVPSARSGVIDGTYGKRPDLMR